MTILLTGASGKVGRFVARELLDHGHTVRAFDHTPVPTEIRSEVEMIFGEMTSPLELMRAAQGCNAIVHLAAIPNPMHGEEQIFPVNVCGTQSLFAAAEGNDIDRVIVASSCSAYGFAFAKEPFDPDYFPIDEEHPLRPQDMYGLSKQLCEETARAYARRGIHSICIRMPEVMRLQGRRQRWLHRRLSHSFDWRSNDYWSYIAAQDAARAYRLAVECELTGSHIINISARDSFGRGDVREAVAKYYPRVAESARNLAPDAALYSSAKARELLGFVAELSWRDIPTLADPDAVFE